jgi:hypothetical protein
MAGRMSSSFLVSESIDNNPQDGKQKSPSAGRALHEGMEIVETVPEVF